MRPRAWIYERLTTGPELVAYYNSLPEAQGGTTDLTTRVFQGEAATSRIITKPFIFYTMGFQTDLGFSETVRPSRHYMQIYVHDRPSNYRHINDILDIISDNSFWEPWPENVYNMSWMENSRDLDDVTMGTIVRYARFTFLRGNSNAS